MDPTVPAGLSLNGKKKVKMQYGTVIFSVTHYFFSYFFYISERQLTNNHTVFELFVLYAGGSSQPRTLPVRAFIGCWWAFCIVIVTTYGGSLIAFLTIRFARLDERIMHYVCRIFIIIIIYLYYYYLCYIFRFI